VPNYSTLEEAKWTTTEWNKNQANLLLVRKWKHDEHIACAQLTQVVSNSVLIQIQHASTLADMWKTIVGEFDHKG